MDHGPKRPRLIVGNLTILSLVTSNEEKFVALIAVMKLVYVHARILPTDQAYLFLLLREPAMSDESGCNLCWQLYSSLR